MRRVTLLATVLGLVAVATHAEDPPDGRKLAQNAVSVAMASRAAGFTGTWASVEEALMDLQKGILLKFEGNSVSFKIVMTSTEEVLAKKYIIFDPEPPGNILYSNKGGG